MNYDYIIVGSGSSGSVVANRLAQNKNYNVLLLEAGGYDDKEEVHIPGKYQTLLGTELDWGYKTEKQMSLENREVAIARGKVLGGCSSINAMIYVRGNASNYDEWASLGNIGWNYQALIPFFNQLENASQDGLPNQEITSPHILSQKFIEAARELNFVFNPNYNNGNQLGVSYYKTNIKNGKRASVANIFINSLLNKENFHLETNAYVFQILFKKDKAIGIAYFKNGKQYNVYADKEIIICAGVFNSPKILLLSGIGPSETLKKLNIPVTHDLPGVGQNLHDHACINLTYESKYSSPDEISNGCEAGLFTRTNLATNTAPDLQMDAVLDLFTDSTPHQHKPTFTLCPIALQPKSRGYVSIRSADPFASPIIQMNYFNNEADFLPLIYGMKLAHEIKNTKSLLGCLGKEITPTIRMGSTPDIINFIRKYATTLWHPVGTCRMGVDDMAVVDPNLNVHGVKGLRVIDASIMPKITSGNTHSPCLVIAAKAASLICKSA